MAARQFKNTMNLIETYDKLRCIYHYDWPVYVNAKSIQQTVLHLELLQTRRHNEHYLVTGWWFPPKQHLSLSKESIHMHYIGLNFMPIFLAGEQGWSSGESTNLPPMWPGLKSWCQCHMWVDFVAGSLPWALREVFLWILRFSPLLKNLHFQNSNSMSQFNFCFSLF